MTIGFCVPPALTTEGLMLASVEAGIVDRVPHTFLKDVDKLRPNSQE
jgi:hypothetical protein